MHFIILCMDKSGLETSMQLHNVPYVCIFFNAKYVIFVKTFLYK